MVTLGELAWAKALERESDWLYWARYVQGCHIPPGSIAVHMLKSRKGRPCWLQQQDAHDVAEAPAGSTVPNSLEEMMRG